MRHLRWGLVGAGAIARKFADGLNSIDEATALAIGSRSLDKAKQFADKHSLPRAYGSYEELLADGEVDAVYIALPNHLHKEWSVKAAEAGKHILCEKPVTMNAEELAEVLAAVREHDVFFMEAFMYRTHPQWKKVREVLEAGAIGEPRILRSAFAFDTGPGHPDSRLLRHDMGGGGLLDVGCYCVSFCRWVAAEEPIDCQAVGNMGRESRVDETMTGVLKFPAGLVAYFTSGVRCNVSPDARIYGEAGSIEIVNPWLPPIGPTPVVVEVGGKVETYEVESGVSQYALEALHVAEHIEERQAPAMSWDDSLGQVRTLDALRKDMGLVWDQEKEA
jgi:predicted dehydrogenase